jgi:WD40 repeat protein
MRKIVAAFVIVVSLFISSCLSSPSPSIPTVTSTLQETATPTQLVDHSTPEITPTLDNPSDKNGGLIATLGETVNRQGYWPALPAFSPDGKMIALVSERVRLWDVESQELIYELGKPYSNCYTENVAFNTDGNLLAASIYCTDANLAGHVLIWDTKSGVLLHNWEQAFSKNTSNLEGILNNHPATGMAFLPKSSILTFANGNTIEIRDIKKASQSVVLQLGEEMVATGIAISRDGKRLFAFMDFSYTKTPNEIGQKYALQIWDLESKSLVDKIDFPESSNTGVFIGHFDTEMKLVGTNLINIDYINKKFTVTDLETNSTRSLYYLGDVKTFISQDTNYVVYLPELDGFDCKNQSVELWNTLLNQSLSAFKTSNHDFGTKWCYGPNTIIFSPDNTILAIAHEERVSLLDISSFTKAKKSGAP